MNNDLILIQDKINTHKSDLAANLAAKSVNANSSETLAVLIGKVKDIEQGGGGSGEGGLDWSTVTDMSYIFYNGQAYFPVLFKTFPADMSHVTTWKYAFNYLKNTNEVIAAIQEKNNFVIDMLDAYMFANTNSGIVSNFRFADQLRFSSDISRCFYYAAVPTSDFVNKIFSNLPTDKSINCGYLFSYASMSSDTIVNDFEINTTNLSNAFSGSIIKKIGNIINHSTSALNIGGLCTSCKYIQEVGKITTQALSTASYNIFYRCSELTKIHGFSVPSQKYQGEIVTSSSYRFISSSSLTKLEECLDIPVVYFRYGGTNIGLSGTASAVKPLRRLTFCQSDEGYYTKNYAKNLPIQYCSFARDGMIEMFNSLPDASDVTATSTITITGNPCVTDGTLTEEDMAIATAKGYVVKTA